MILKYQKKCCICREADAKLLFPNCLLGFVVNNAIERMIRLIDPFNFIIRESVRATLLSAISNKSPLYFVVSNFHE